TFARLVIGKEHQPLVINSLEQDNARRRSAAGVCGGQGHGVGFNYIGLERLVKPDGELFQGRGSERVLEQDAFLIDLADIGDGHEMLTGRYAFNVERTILPAWPPGG